MDATHGQPGGTKRVSFKIDVDEGVTVADIDKLLASSYNDPTQSRLLEAARAALLTRPKPTGGEEMIPIKTHIDDHTDIPIEIG